LRRCRPEQSMRVKPPLTTFGVLRGSEGGIADEQNTKTNNRNPDPAPRAHVLMEPKMAQQSYYGISNRGGWLHVTKIRPRKNQRIAHQVGEQRSDSKPHDGGGKGAEKKVKDFDRRPRRRNADHFHAF